VPTPVAKLRLGHAVAAAIALLVVIFCAVGCTKKAPEFVQDAKRLLTESKRDAAIIQLRNALTGEPNNVEVIYLLGKTYWENGDLVPAEAQLRKLLALGAPKSNVLPLLGRVLLERENYKAILDEIVSSPDYDDASRVELALLRGHAYLATGVFAEAKLHFDLAKSAKPVDAELGLAKIAVLRDDLAAAEKIVDSLLVQAPNNAQVWLLKGDLLGLRSQPEQALDAYQRASKVQPDSVLAHLAQAVHYINAGNNAAAQGAVTKASSLAPNSPTVGFTRALLSLREKKFNECRDALQRVFAAIPEHMPSILVAASLHYSIGALEQAQSLYTRYLLKFPGSVYARKMLADTLIRNGQPQSAVYLLQPFLSQGFKDGEILTLAGQAHLQLGQYDQAIKYLETSVALDPKNSNKLTSLAASRLAAGDDERGLIDLEAAIQINAADLRAGHMLVVTMIGRNELEKAMSAVQALEKTQTNNPLIYSLKSAVYVAKQDFVQARASLEHALTLQPTYFPAAAALAQIDLRENNRPAARGRLAAILSKDQTNLDAMVALAGMAFGEGQQDEAIKWLTRAVSAHPQAAQAYVLLARLYMQVNQPKAALETARKARQLNISDPQLLEILGAAQLVLNDTRGAVVSYLALTKALPKSVAAHLKLASAYAADSNQRLATAATEKALELQPASMEARIAMAEIHLRAQRYSEVMKVARQLQQQHGNLVQGYVLEADVHWAQNNHLAAAQSYEQALTKQRTGRLIIRLHQAQSRAKMAASDKFLLDWLKATPNDVEARSYLARVYLDAGSHKDAITQYKLLLQRNPKDTVTLNSLAWALQDEAPAEAIQYAQQAVDLQPEDAAAVDTLGWLLTKNNQLQRGLTLLQKALTLDPDTPEIRFHFATALLNANDTARARRELEIVVASKKPFSGLEEARSMLARIGR
jgi:putative PEP-CTERM system TPR-repeat lipoprotein